MANTTLKSLSLILSLLYISGGTMAVELTPAENFVDSACFITRYPECCRRSLMPQANVINQSFHELARAALAVGLETAESTKANMMKLANLKGLKPMEYGSLKDCIDQVDDSVDRLSQSVREIVHLGPAHGEELSWHGSNVETWTNAALSQVESCADGFLSQTLSGKIGTLVQGQVTDLVQSIYVALDLFKLFANRFAAVSDDV